MPNIPRQIHKMYFKGQLTDLEVRQDGRTRRLAGRRGPGGEAEALAGLPPGHVPVFLGAGLGGGLAAWLSNHARDPRAKAVVVDAEADLAQAAGTDALAAQSGRVVWLDDPSPKAVAARLAALQDELGTLFPLPHPFYMRLDPAYYADLAAAVTALAGQSPWRALAGPRFRGNRPRILLYAPRYHLVAELARAAQTLGIEVHALDVASWEHGKNRPPQALLEAAAAFKPDFALAVNHLGLDRQGAMVGLHEKMRLPLASWLVDHPETILASLPDLASPWVTILTWDRQTVPLVNDLGHGPALHLPLGVDPAVFRPAAQTSVASPFTGKLVFVGRTLADKLAWLYAEARFPAFFLRRVRELARELRQSGQVSALALLQKGHPELWERLTRDARPEMKSWAQMALFWEATRIGRSRDLLELAPFNPLVVGDPWMGRRLARAGSRGGWLPAQPYEDVLPDLYRTAAVNFNTSTGQTRSGLNQRFYDVPASGGFLLTDAPDELEDSFEPGREVAVYASTGNIREACAQALADPAWRAKVALAGQKRALACHTYAHRLKTVCDIMRQRYAGW